MITACKIGFHMGRGDTLVRLFESGKAWQAYLIADIYLEINLGRKLFVPIFDLMILVLEVNVYREFFCED